MKTIKALLFIPVFFILLTACSSSDDAPAVIPVSQYAMKAKVNGVLWNMNNPFGSNYATPPIFTYYPEADFIQLQGRKGGTFGIDEMILYIKRTDLVVGTYPIGMESFDGTKTQIDINYNSFETIQNVISGTLSITAVNTIAKTVKGTFSFVCADNFEPIGALNPVTNTVTQGSFSYRYDVEN